MRALLLVISFCIITQQSKAQAQLPDPEFGHSIGINVSYMMSTVDIKIPEGYRLKGKPEEGYGMAFNYTRNYTRYISFQSGVVYHSMFNTIYKDSKEQYRIHLDNLHFPFMMQVNMEAWDHLSYSLFAGPQLGITVASSWIATKEEPDQNQFSERGSDDIVLSVNPVDFGFAFGASVNLGLTANDAVMFELGFLGTLGLADISGPVAQNQINVIADETTKKSYGIYGGLSFGL